MSNLQLTKASLKQGIWEGILTGAPVTEKPALEARHGGQLLDGLDLTPRPEENCWIVRLTIPSEAISDGMQTILITETGSDLTLAHIQLMTGDEAHEDLRGELDLMRAELDLLKRAFRRHCVETT
ncbi:MAG: hypothetical protein P1U53_09215 [Sulfitobacter sp.]|nr:hypothetical protein [Sulfitobacter sp.]